MDVVHNTETDEYAVQVSEVPKRVCEMVFDNLITSYSVEIGADRKTEATDDDLCDEKKYYGILCG